MKLKSGQIKAPVVNTPFGDVLKLDGLINQECDCLMVLINTGDGINAGHLPQPVGFMKLTHQVYVADIEALIEKYECAHDNTQHAFSMPPPLRWITVCPVRSKDHLDIWEAA